MRLSKPSLALALSLGLMSFDTAAAIITFDFSTTTATTPTLSVTSGGVTVDMTNPTGHPPNSSFTTFSPVGFFVTDTGNNGLLSFDLKFTSAAKITAYSVGYVQDLTAASFDLTGGRAGAASSLNNSLLTVNSFNLSSDYILDANQTGHFAASIAGTDGDRLSVLKNLTIDTTVPSGNVPEPGSLALFTIGLAGFAVRRKNRLV